MKIFIQCFLATVVIASARVQASVVKGSKTIFMEEVNGVPGNSFITSRNNGELVDAAFDDTADRQFTPSKTSNGVSVILFQRSFSSGFRPDLVGVQACMAFNGTDFKAEKCEEQGVQYVSLVGNVLRAGKACHSGHDDRAQITVDPDGQNCASVNTTPATPATP